MMVPRKFQAVGGFIVDRARFFCDMSREAAALTQVVESRGEKSPSEALVDIGKKFLTGSAPWRAEFQRERTQRCFKANHVMPLRVVELGHAVPVTRFGWPDRGGITRA
jgi:hypothetical protein